jgi:toxin-antitoxin system PIN domain toxin
MTVVDVNVLIHAANRAAPVHEVSLAWLTRAANGTAAVLLPWVSILGFVRLTTHPRVLPRPLSNADAWKFVDRLLAAPAVRTADPAPGHAAAVERLLAAVPNPSRLTTHAHLAAIALENHAEVVTWDTDFSLFPSVRWRCPTLDG